MKISHTLGAGAVSLLAVTLAGCSILQPEETGLGDNITVSSSEESPYQAKDIDDKEVTSNLASPVKDDGLGVSWELQGVYTDYNSGGSVVTILLKNENEMALPTDAFDDPVLERADGNGGWSKVKALPYSENSGSGVEPPGLDHPLGAGASVNLQYRYDVAPGNLWNARLHIGNVTWVGDLNL
ncbi:hypothetical protein GWO53_08315 [Corynebacterium macginleyi]|uniref:Uncharacterized protein n=1 Tax=Corynebacterium macginleyi TaxID=38290 RepID=A0A3M0H465_9CORY|nr:hypothetical protein [Corynebacterium macginleyi]MBK4138369.1 hypothetical protein [Corynebacterium macginleyi]MBK4140452.1 hypothetical protein [Corynebacterium macginleyi]MBK4142739.1 hypothetical protein [Corynebacterium macginleyi]MBK4144978.1 hypothetical protein [Corynebacterium macginleyi]MBK4146329.1 hypothetical protein [Corynebacterium macginleyi]